MLELLCSLNADKEMRDRCGKSALITFSEAGRTDLELLLLLCGYDMNRWLNEPRVSHSEMTRYHQKDLLFALQSGDAELLRMLVAFGAELDAAVLGINLKHVCLNEQRLWGTTSDRNAPAPPPGVEMYRLLDRFGVCNCKCENCRNSLHLSELRVTPTKSSAASKAPTDLCQPVPRRSQSVRQFLEWKKAPVGVQRAFCRLLLEDLQFVPLAELFATSDCERLAIFEYARMTRFSKYLMR